MKFLFNKRRDNLALSYVYAANHSANATRTINDWKNEKNWDKYEYWRKRNRKACTKYYNFINRYKLKDVVYLG